MSMAIDSVFSEDEPITEGRMKDLALMAPMAGFALGTGGMALHDAATGPNIHDPSVQAQFDREMEERDRFDPERRAREDYYRRLQDAVPPVNPVGGGSDTFRTPEQQAHDEETPDQGNDQHYGPMSLEEVGDLITQHEGNRRYVYDDKTGKRLRPGQASKGNRTVGVGFNMDQKAALRYWKGAGGTEQSFKDVYYGRKPIDTEVAKELFQEHLARSVRQARTSVPDLDDHPTSVQTVLVDMAYNLGSLRGWPRFIKAVNNHDYRRAAKEMKYKKKGTTTDWWNQVGQRAEKLHWMMLQAAEHHERPVKESLGGLFAGPVGDPLLVTEAHKPEHKEPETDDEWRDAVPNSERTLNRHYLDEDQGKHSSYANPRLTVAMAVPKSVYRLYWDGKMVGWVDFRDKGREVHAKGEWTEPKQSFDESRRGDLMAYLDKIQKKPRKVKETSEPRGDLITEDEDKGPPSKADQSKVDAIINNKDMPETAEDGKAYIVHWADGRGVFAVKKKSALQRWLQKVGDWAEIISIKYAEPVWGSKKTKLKVKTDIKESEETLVVEGQGVAPLNVYHLGKESNGTGAGAPKETMHRAVKMGMPWKITQKTEGHGLEKKTVANKSVYIYWGGRKHATDNNVMEAKQSFQFVIMNIRGQMEYFMFLLGVAAVEGLRPVKGGSYKFEQGERLWPTFKWVFGMTKEPKPKDYPQVVDMLNGKRPAAQGESQEVRKAKQVLGTMGVEIDWDSDDLYEIPAKGNAKAMKKWFQVMASNGWIDPTIMYDEDTDVLFVEPTPTLRK